jgi:S1-C subfamily serine protease
MKTILDRNDLSTFTLGVLAGFSCLGGVPVLPAAEVDARRDSTVEAVERVLPSVVNIATATIVRRGDPFEDMWNQFWDPYHRRQTPGSVGYSLGSGVIIDEEGYVLTNDHVARRAAKIWIKPTMSTNVYEALVAAEDSRADVALLKIQAKPGEKFTAIKFGQDDDLLLGETVLALGNPFGLGGSVSRGILSSKSRMPPKETEQLDIPNWLQTDASINPGSSGGPLVNLRGELIGMNVAVLANAQGIGFAIPVKRVAEALSQMITPESSSKRLWFGARVRAGAGPLAITAVQPESPAAKAGLKEGDIIAQVDGQTPKGFIHLNEMLLAGPKRERTFTVLRQGERRTVTVALLPESTFFDAALIEKKLGVTLQELTPKLAREQGVEVAAGLLVTRVERDTPAAESLQPGFLITSIDDRRPADLVEAAKWIHAKKPGETVQLGLFVRQRYGYRAGTIDLPVR